MKRHVAAYGVTVLVALLLSVFIAYPLGSVLVESFSISGPLPLPKLRQITLDALDKMEPAKREKSMALWLKKVKPRQRMEATAAALELIGRPVPWDRKIAFDKQIPAADKAVADLDTETRARFDEQFPISVVMLHKRISLAFKIKKKISTDEFDSLRSGEQSGFGLTHYISVVTDSRLVKAARNSLTLALIACVLTTSLAFAIAFGINRGGIAFPTLARYATLTPLVSPPVMIATAAILMFGRNGAFTKGLLDQTLGWIDADVTNLYGFGGVIVAQVFGFLPPAFIIMDNVLSKYDGRVEEAAASQGASAWEIFSRITLPLSQPGLIRTFILCFVLSMTDFANPMVIGRDFPVLAGILYDEIIGFQNTELAAAIAVWIIVPAISIYFLLERIGRRKRFDTGNSTGGPPELPVPLSVKIGLTTISLLVIGLIVVLYGSVVVGSFVRLWGFDYTFTIDYYTSTDAVPGFVSQWEGVQVIWKSLQVAAIAAPMGGLLALVLAYLVERVHPPGGNIMSFVAMLPAVLPGVIFGIGYIIAFNYPFGMKELALTGTMAILVINILFGNIFVGVLAGRAVLQRIDASVDEAAEILGASLMQRFTRVILPMMYKAALLGTLYVFVHGMTTLSAVIFLMGPDHKLASYGIFSNAISSFYGVACAMSVSILLIVFTVMGAMALLERHGPVWMRIGTRQTIRGGQ
ncbi:MAG: iron ABC transporter permease [Alphaproteobacteria bacterium]